MSFVAPVCAWLMLSQGRQRPDTTRQFPRSAPEVIMNIAKQLIESILTVQGRRIVTGHAYEVTDADQQNCQTTIPAGVRRLTRANPAQHIEQFVAGDNARVERTEQRVLANASGGLSERNEVDDEA